MSLMTIIQELEQEAWKRGVRITEIGLTSEQLNDLTNEVVYPVYMDRVKPTIKYISGNIGDILIKII